MVVTKRTISGFNTTYYASAELSATNLCFMLYQEIVVGPTLKIPPELISLSDGLPTQSVYVKPCSFTPFVHLH